MVVITTTGHIIYIINLKSNFLLEKEYFYRNNMISGGWEVDL